MLDEVFEEGLGGGGAAIEAECDVFEAVDALMDALDLDALDALMDALDSLMDALDLLIDALVHEATELDDALAEHLLIDALLYEFAKLGEALVEHRIELHGGAVLPALSNFPVI